MKRIFLFKTIAVSCIFAVSCASGRSQKNIIVEECDIENQGTRKFLEEVTYSDTTYTVSFARDYKKQYGANDKPLPVTISWEGEPAYSIYLTTQAKIKESSIDFENAIALIPYHPPRFTTLYPASSITIWS